MAERTTRGNRKSRTAFRGVRGGLAAGMTASAVLVCGIPPLTNPPTARADLFDLLIDDLTGVGATGPMAWLDPGAGVDGSSPVLDSWDFLDGLGSAVGADSAAADLLQAIYLPLHALDEAWINSPFGQLGDPAYTTPFELLTGRGLIESGLPATAQEPGGGDGGWLFGDGGAGYDASGLPADPDGTAGGGGDGGAGGGGQIYG